MSNFRRQFNAPEIRVSPRGVTFVILGALIIFILIVAGSQATDVVEPGHRGVRVTLGKVSPTFEQEGFLFKAPFISRIHQVSVRQQTDEIRTEFYSSDLQQVKAAMRILYRVPESSVVTIFRDFQGDPLPTLIAPRVIEALKEVASAQSAELIVQSRETIKQQTLEATRRKIGDNGTAGPLLVIEDITLSDLALSPELNAAIEQKMTQREEAERAKFIQRQAEIEAETAIIKAKGEAEAIEIRGKALRENPAFIRLKIVETWDGTSPLVIGGEGEGANIMVPLQDLEGRR